MSKSGIPFLSKYLSGVRARSAKRSVGVGDRTTGWAKAAIRLGKSGTPCRNQVIAREPDVNK